MFNTNRYLLIASTIGIVAVVCLMLLYRQLALSSLLDHETRSNVALTEVLSNSIWSRYRYLLEAGGADVRAPGAAHPETQRLDADVKRLMYRSKVVKVKVYDLNGLTLYSSDPSQIGEDKSGNQGFMAARAGKPASNITYRDHFDAFEGRLSNLNLVSSYIPIRSRSSSSTEAVFEVYSDVTGMIGQMQRVQWQIVIGVLGSVAILYVLLLVAARRVDRIELQRRQEAARNEAEILYQSFHDPLTALPNRAHFLEHLKRKIKRAESATLRFAVMSLDVDRFKMVNDSFGHDAGDELLRLISNRLRACAGQRDSLFRMGGDEFTILPEDLACPEGAIRLAECVLKVMKEPFVVNSQAIVASISVGISVYPDDDVEPARLVKNADAAMYLAKEAGGNQSRFYTPELNAHAQEHLALESALQQAMEKGEFLLHYQPRLAVDETTVIGFEALLRWQRGYDLLVPPVQFIPLMEKNGMIVTVGQWVLNEACSQCKAWQLAGHEPVRISVNVSPLQFREHDFVGRVKDALARTGLHAGYLELELTESALLDKPDEAIATMQALRALGVVLSLDDFGTGYSSLSYLQKLPVDYLKIDRCFVQDLDDDPQEAATVAAIVGIARSLGIGLVAEGVEKPAQAAHLIAAGCQELQGFLYSKPLPAALAAHWLNPAKNRRVVVR